ncbi:MAG: glycosyltransferase [Desulfuromonadaceae bacterium]
MRILICSPEYNPATGNWISARRYQRGLERHGHEVHLCHLDSAAASLERGVEMLQPDILILIHAFRTGRQWLNSPGLRARHRALRVVVMLSGTDINEGLYDPLQGPVIKKVMHSADALLIQNPIEARQLREANPVWAQHLHEIPPGIELGMEPYPLREKHHLSSASLLFLCPASIRPVKGVLELMELFDLLSRRSRSWELVFCGPELDGRYNRHFFAAVDARPWAHYIGILPPESMGDILRQVDVVVNNFVSEGMPNALIEAAVVGCPILAHDIPGNRPIVEHGINGLLYVTREDFKNATTRLLEDEDLRRSLARPSPERYSPEREAQALHELCCTLNPDPERR